MGRNGGWVPSRRTVSVKHLDVPAEGTGSDLPFEHSFWVLTKTSWPLPRKCGRVAEEPPSRTIEAEPHLKGLTAMRDLDEEQGYFEAKPSAGRE